MFIDNSVLSILKMLLKINVVSNTSISAPIQDFIASIFTLPVFSATINVRKILTFNFQ